MSFSPKSNTQTSKKVSKQDEEDGKFDEFSSGSDHDYESPEEKTGEENYICSFFELRTAEEGGCGEKDDENNSLKPTLSSTVRDCHREKSSNAAHPHRAQIKPPLRRPLNSPSEIHYSDLNNEKTKKTVRSCPSQRTFSQPKGSAVKASGSSVSRFPQPRPPLPTNVFKRTSKLPPVPPVPTQPMKLNKASGSSVSRFPQPRPPLPTNVFKRTSKLPPVPPVPTQPMKLNKATPEPKKCLDPSWYRGNVTRHEAEAALRRVNKDGAFIVRDSSQGSAEHPHTLMLLNQGKVYNIRIRRRGNSYSLGNGFNGTQSFPGVTEVILHHTHTPLVLIDATDQTSAEKPQCCLLHPAGL
ncbi:lymphocyte cytosolic protein 2 isoform X1 [Austrofundulus limnaeus]|uniref:Lymphocyte cytosolic protein 2 isoform X1 n=1 Tax=Austrofundulus limnaeus TaxID=52670 RepID=A0A2I4CHZ8_AUSLI|nr:PREDICTED: lymphocyte cytosolic protein 2-like isoform X1 [Austrofundulus limnaeus]